MFKDGVLYWITGLSGAGKTTIGNRLYYELKKENKNVLLLDGDILKNIISDEVGYSDEERKKRAMKYAQICKMLTDQGMIVICCTIAMYDEVRNWNRKNNKGYVEVFLNVPIEILCERDQKGLYSQYKQGKINNLKGIDMEVDFPKTPDIEIRNDGSKTIAECVKEILNYEVDLSSDFDRDSDYWNKYYKEHLAPEEPSLFAKWVAEDIRTSTNLLELGCGNGRDSLYFYSKGINVTAVDASSHTIEQLREKYAEDNICFICDDFVCASTIFSGQYDYCYSRFSLHAINELQETEVIKNVYKVLKTGGKFYIEVRSINDDLYGKGEQVDKDSYFYNGHFRRFVRKKVLEEKLKKIGFIIEYSEEKTGFAPYKDSNPPVIRIIAQK